MLKRFYHILAWFAVANLFAVGGLVGYLFASGKLNAERVDQIAVVLRGEFPKPQVRTTQPAAQDEKPQTSQEELARLKANEQYYALISERKRRDLEDQNALNQSIRLDANRLIEKIETKEQEFTQQQLQAQKVADQNGFQQSLDVFSEMEPKLARDVLRTNFKEADAVRIFMRMDNGRRKKIVNSCKTPEEKAWVSTLLTRMQGLDAAQANADVASKTGQSKPPG